MLVKIEFVDGTEEIVESSSAYGFDYDEKNSMFRVLYSGSYIMYPREFVKSIRICED